MTLMVRLIYSRLLDEETFNFRTIVRRLYFDSIYFEIILLWILRPFYFGFLDDLTSGFKRFTIIQISAQFHCRQLIFFIIGTKCGPQVITGWTTTLDQLLPYGSAAVTSPAGQFTPATGRFKPPLNGYYKICAYFRS